MSAKMKAASFTYEITGVPDLDQRWDALPKDGSMYCVPTATMNWIYYIAKHGLPHAPAEPISNDKDTSSILTNLLIMGTYMGTHPTKGTTGTGAFDGLVDYLDNHGVPSVVLNDGPHSGFMMLDDLEAVTAARGLATVTRGRYEKLIPGNDTFFRTGGHVMSLVGLRRKSIDTADIDVRDPASDSANLNTQSQRVSSTAQLKQEVRNIEGETELVLRWGTDNDPFEFMDGWQAILPTFALTNPTANVILAHKASFESKAIDTREIPLPFNGELADLAIYPAAPRASMIARGSGDIWTLNLAEDSWSKTATVSSPQFLTYGGRDRRLFVVQGKEILSFDRTGKPLDKIDTGVAIQAISYDQKNERLIAAAPSKKRLLAVTPALKVVDSTEAPEVPGNGRLAMSVNGRDATIVLSREGSPEAATIRWHSTGARAAGRFRLMTEGRTGAAHVDRKGRLVAVDNGKIASFDSDGDRIAVSVFEGLPAGPLLKVARSSHNFDPVRSQRKEWRN